MIYVDSNLVIRLVEGDIATRTPIENKLLPHRGNSAAIITSRLTRLECRVKPLRTNDTNTLAIYAQFFAGVELSLIDIDSAVVEKATDLRAVYNFKTPDAIHVASAIVGGATRFFTGDRNLVRCQELAVEIV